MLKGAFTYVQDSDDVVQNVTSQSVIRALIGRRSENSKAKRFGSRSVGSGFADEGVVAQLILHQMALVGIELSENGRVDRLFSQRHHFLE
jgi:hypothetical protein